MWKTRSCLVVIVLVLSTLGIVMLASTSSARGAAQYQDAYYFVKRQALWLFVALIAGFLAALLPYRAWRLLAAPLAVVSIVLLILVLIPPWGVTINGSSRWLRVGPMRFQPSELSKLAVVVLISAWLAGRPRQAKRFVQGLVLPGGAIGVFVFLIYKEPDYGTMALIGVGGGIQMLLAGTHLLQLLCAGAGAGVAFVVLVMKDPVRWNRIISFLHREEYAQSLSFQLTHALYAFVLGGASGVGLGRGLQKQFYLPEAHTDFLFAIVGEELGLGATLAVVALYLGFFLCGVRISLRAPDPFGRLLGLGLTLMITLQAIINIGVVTGSLPTKGLSLPFMSFGGSSLVVSMVMVGVLVNLAGQAVSSDEERDALCIRDAAQRL